jgi:hypothetical protein
MAKSMTKRVGRNQWVPIPQELLGWPRNRVATDVERVQVTCGF